ncbi:MAG: cytochrome P460 family protein [Deltaproteobacteria bacterium]|nr:cytochrome P460 family protein [Deltaproteobacteria bacterium]MDQ3299707.1 cytochrome P460 family protein [Myxococcota bacterium]
MTRLALVFVVLASGITVSSCGDDGSSTGDPPLFPADYAATYQEVRGCRFSVEHDSIRVRVLASPDAVTAYNGRTAPFPTGSIILKEEFDESDTACAGPIVEVTVMQKLAVGSSPDTLDWTWQKATVERVIETDIMRCTRCHTSCGKPPEGYDGTCTVP